MRRRAFIAGLGGSAAAWPATTWAQQGGPVRRVGVLMAGADDAVGQARLAAFRRGLKELNWAEDTNFRLEVRWGRSEATLIRAQVAELVGLAPDVILGSNTPVLRALKQATQTIPVVFAGLADPVGDKIVNSLSRPGGNITGFASFDGPLGAKWLQLLKEIAPDTTRVAVVFNPGTAPHTLFWPQIEAAAPGMGVTLVRAEVHDAPTIENAISAFAREPHGGLLVFPDVFNALNRGLIISLAEKLKLPAIYPLKYFAVDGGLISYGPDFDDQFRRAAAYVDRILKGAKPADLPVQEPVKLELVLNLKAAKALGLTVPSTTLARADEVIE